MKIPHNDPNTIDITLKLGRYKILGGLVETSNPKSELTLDNEELNNLISYLSENYKPVSLGEGEYINVDNGQAELIEQLKSVLEGSEETASALIQSGILTTDVYYAANIINRKKQLKNLKICFLRI